MDSTTEWQSRVVNGQMSFVTKGEAEYTAELAFAIAVAMSWWAVRVDRAKLKLTPMPQPNETGDRRRWHEADDSAARDRATPLTASRLGLKVPVMQPSWFAKRYGSRQAEQFMSDEIVDMPEALYAGRSHVRVRRTRTKWSSKFITGPDGDSEECMAKYTIALFCESNDKRIESPTNRSWQTSA